MRCSSVQFAQTTPNTLPFRQSKPDIGGGSFITSEIRGDRTYLLETGRHEKSVGTTIALDANRQVVRFGLRQGKLAITVRRNRAAGVHTGVNGWTQGARVLLPRIEVQRQLALPRRDDDAVGPSQCFRTRRRRFRFGRPETGRQIVGTRLLPSPLAKNRSSSLADVEALR